MPEKNLCKKDKSIYTKKIYEENIDRLHQMRYELALGKEEEKIDFEKKYLKTGIEFIRTIISNEFSKRIARTKRKNEIKKLYDLNKLWEDANSRLKIAFNLCDNIDELREGSERICEIVSSLSCKDIRTYNMLPVWDCEKQSMVINLAIQNYELLIDDFLNKLGSNGLAKIDRCIETEIDYANREELDSRLENAVLNMDSNLILKSLRDGAYVDLKLEADDFDFYGKPCTVFNYMLIIGNDDVALDILRYGANVNIKNMDNYGNVFLPIVYALEKGNLKLIVSILNNGVILDEKFIGKNIRHLFRKVLDIDNNLSNLSKLKESVLENLYVNDFISIDEIKEVLKEDDRKILMRALENNDSILISKLLSAGVRYQKDEKISQEIEHYLNSYKVEDDIIQFFGYRPNVFNVIPKEDIMIKMYIGDLISVDKIVDIYKKNRDYILKKIWQLGSELLFFNFLNKGLKDDLIDKETLNSLVKYLKKQKDEDSVISMYINGLISLDVMISVLGKDITYFLESAINKGNDILIIKLLDSGANLCKKDKRMLDKVRKMIELVKDYLENDKNNELVLLDDNVKMIELVDNYEKYIHKSNNKMIEREEMMLERSVDRSNRREFTSNKR